MRKNIGKGNLLTRLGRNLSGIVILGNIKYLWAFAPFDGTSGSTDVSGTLQVALCTRGRDTAVIGRLMRTALFL